MIADHDGIYLNDQLVAPPDGIATTLTGNDLTKPASINFSHTNEFHLPDSLLVRGLLANSEQLDSGEDYPYQSLDARIVANGEIILSGVAELGNFSAGWDVALFESRRDLFTRLERSIRTGDFARYDHTRTLAVINARATATEGYCYPMVDYGLLSGGVLLLEALFPAMYLHTVLTQLLHEEGYTHVGKLVTDPLYTRLVIPFVEAEGQANDEQWQADRKARVTLASGPEERFDTNTFGGATAYDRVQPYVVDNLPLENFEQGRLKPFNTTTYSYVCPSNMRVTVEAFQQLKVMNALGETEAILIIEKNGQEVERDYRTFEKNYNLLLARTDTLSVSKKVNCVAGDQLRIRLIVRRRTRLGAFSVRLATDPHDSGFAMFTPDLSIEVGDNWLTARNLPDISGVDVMKAVAYLYGGTWSINQNRREVSFVSLTDTINNTGNAVDWTDRINTGDEPAWTPKLEPYGQRNHLKWKESDEAKAQASGSVNYGDGLISINATTIAADTDLFEVVFAASTQSTESLPGYGEPVKIPTRVVSGGNVSQQSVAPRLLLVNPATPATVPVSVLDTDGVTLRVMNVSLPPAWFGVRPTAAVNVNTNFCLCFSKVAGLNSEQCLIDRHYPGLLRVLRRMRVLTLSMYLSPVDVAQLDFGVPVLLGSTQAGSLILTPSYYYVNQVSDYQAGKVVSVVLIGF